MSAAAQYTRREEVTFVPNVPVTLALKYAQGRTVSGMSGERIMYSLVDGRVLFLDLEVAAQIEALGINIRESFSITKRLDAKASLVTWEVARMPGEQPSGTSVIPAKGAEHPKPAGAAESSVPRKPAASCGLAEEANALVDVYAEVLKRALEKYQGRVKPDEVKSLLITSYIQWQKLSSAA